MPQTVRRLRKLPVFRLTRVNQTTFPQGRGHGGAGRTIEGKRVAAGTNRAREAAFVTGFAMSQSLPVAKDRLEHPQGWNTLVIAR